MRKVHPAIEGPSRLVRTVDDSDRFRLPDRRAARSSNPGRSGSANAQAANQLTKIA